MPVTEVKHAKALPGWRKRDEMYIIPAIDLIDGAVVRLKQGDYNAKTVYASDPLVMAQQFEAVGLNRLHLVDLDGAKAGAVKNGHVLARLARETDLQIDFGGGIKKEESLREVLEAGATQVTCGSIAVKQKAIFEGWIERYEAGTFILAADCRDRMIASGGWLETSELSVFEFIDTYAQLGVQHILCTDIARDGMLSGPSVGLYKEIIAQFPDLKLIASGGVSSLKDLEELQGIGCWGVVTGKAIYEGRFSLNELATFIQQNQLS